jgi:hypothetical protein
MTALQTTTYLVVKLIAPTYASRKFYCEPSATEVTTPATVSDDDDDNDEPASIADGPSVRIDRGRHGCASGHAGHLEAELLHLSPVESARCKNIAEAERYVKAHFESWLANAYDWFVVPVSVSAPGNDHQSTNVPKEK